MDRGKLTLLLTLLLAACGCDRQASRLATQHGIRRLSLPGHGALSEAKEHFDVAIELDPQNAKPYEHRAQLWVYLGQFQKAQSDFERAIELNPTNPMNYARRAHFWFRMGRYDLAIDDFQDAIKHDPTESLPFYTYNGLAWLYATARDDDYRNGPEAVKWGKKACQLTDWKDAAILDTLAAAYAEAGDFEMAIEYQTQAIRRARGGLRAELMPRLGLYKRGKSYQHDDLFVEPLQGEVARE